MLTSRLVLPLIASLTLAPLVAAGDEPTFEQRLEKLAESLEEARVEGHIPGMSIAIVKDDEVVWARGFGLANVETGAPADAETIYAVGSTTKAFTATLIGMMVDEGKADWDDPVTRYLPYFDLAVRSDDEDAECNLRDLLSHRHGFSRMGILWFGSTLSREEILRTAAGAEPWDDFRAGFHYCNVTYLAAGEAAGVAAGSSWDELMVQRIFEPLGMTSSNLQVSEAQQDERLALGYKWEKSEGEVEHMKMVSLDTIGPAGSVNSNVLDMAQWLRLQLGQGKFAGEQLISSERLHETWEPQIEIGGGVDYGMGWMLREHDGRRLVEHGGNIDGFSAQVGFMPEENLGFVLLMNLNGAPLQQPSLPLVFDALLDEWPDEEVTTDAGEVDFEDYVGTYIANFGPFTDEKFQVLVEGDHLAVDVPSQQTFALKNPGEDGRWPFALTDQIALSFQRDDQGAVVTLTMHQAGFDFEVPREGYEPEPEVPARALKRYLGTFVRANGGKQVKLTIESGRLTMEDKGQLLAFHTPDAEGHATLRARADWGATFKVDAEGNVDSFVFHGAAGDQLFNRLVETGDTTLPTLEEVLALRKTEARIAAIKSAGGSKATGEVWFAQAGVRGRVTLFSQGSDRYANHMEFGKYGQIDLVVRGEQGWSFNTMRGFDVLKGDQLAQAILGNGASVEGDWSEYFETIEVVRTEELDGRPVIVLRLASGDLPSRTYWVDAENGDVLRTKQIMIEGPVRLPITTIYSEFVERDGLRYATHVENSNPASGRTVLTFDGYESGLDLDEAVFTLEDPGDK